MLVTPLMALVTTATPGRSVVGVVAGTEFGTEVTVVEEVVVEEVVAMRVCSATLSATMVTTWANASTLPTDVPPNFMTNIGESSKIRSKYA
jgi:hypothetical protein